MEGLMFLISLPFVALYIFAWFQIFKKAGYNGWMCLLMIIPIIGVIWFLVFAFGRWPIEDRLTATKTEHTLPF